MCAVAAIPALIGIGVSVAATAVSTGLQVDAEQKAAAAKEDAARQNARIAIAQRNAAVAEGVHAASAVAQESRQIEATTRALGATSGVQTAQGAGSAFAAAQDISAIKTAAARKAWGYDIEADQSLTKAAAAKEAGILGAASAGLSGASSMGSLAIQGSTLINTYK